MTELTIHVAHVETNGWIEQISFDGTIEQAKTYCDVKGYRSYKIFNKYNEKVMDHTW